MNAIDGALRTQTPVENNNEKQQITAFGGDGVRRGWTLQAHQAAPSRQKSPQRSPTRASCAALVNALFWKILVTRVKSFFAARPGAASPPFRVPGAAQREYNESHGPVARFAMSGLMMLDSQPAA